MRSLTTLLVFSFFSTLAFGQVDTAIVKRKIDVYTLSENYTRIVPVKLDTLFTDFQNYRTVDKHTPFYASLGNYGLPIEEIDFFKRTNDPDRFIYRHYLPYMHHSGNKLFFDTQVPFTELFFTFGGGRTEAEQTFLVRHSQNVNQYLNFGLDLDVINSLGQYSYQNTDNKSFTLHSSYLGDKYKLYAAWSMNGFLGAENGGLSDISQISTLSTRDLPTNLGGLSNAQSIFKHKEVLLVQSYSIGGGKEVNDSTEKRNGVKGIFSHVLSWENGKKYYTDEYPDNEFYDTTYITGIRNNVSTFDSLYSRTVKNSLRFDFSAGESRKFQIDIGVGIVNELNVYSQIRPTHDTIFFADTLKWNRSSNAVFGGLSNRIGNFFSWSAEGKLYFTGQKAGDIILKGDMNSRIGKGKWASDLYGKGAFMNQGPSFWHNSWGANHFEWDNDFEKELRISVGGGYRIPGINFDVSMDYALITNHIYFNTDAMPEQFSGSVSVLSFRVNKLFMFWKFRFDNQLLSQTTSHSNIISLPAFAAKSSFYFDHLFYFKVTDGRLGFQLGVEGIYNTSYFANDYNPSIGSYYRQSDLELGNYPYLNAFVNLKIKRTRIYIAFEHVNHGMGSFGNDYQYVPNYLMPTRMFKYGVAWTFYD